MQGAKQNKKTKKGEQTRRNFWKIFGKTQDCKKEKQQI